MERSFAGLDAQLQGRCAESRKVDNHTHLKRRGPDAIAVCLHQTDILTFNRNGSIVLNTGGWQTVTTRDRINDFLPAGYFLWIEERVAFLSSHGASYDKDHSVPYADGMMIMPDGSTKGSATPEETKQRQILRKRILRFSAEYVKQMQADKIPAPSTGDCFYCGMSVAEGANKGKGLGDAIHDTDHLMSHLDEGYFVPSLLVRALEYKPVSQMVRGWVGWKWKVHNTDCYWIESLAVRDLRTSLKRYLFHSFGFGD